MMAATAVMLFLLTLGIYLASSDAQSAPVEGEDYIAALSFSSASTTLDPEDDGVSKPILIREGFPIGSALQYHAYVGTNGIISFGKGFRFFEPLPFPTSSSAVQSHTVVAPFWTDNDLRLSGKVMHEVVENPSTPAMEKINNYISFQTGTTFTGTWMLLAVWSNVHPFPHGVNITTPFYTEYTAKTNSYQAVVVTNDTTSYAVFTYNCSEMSWSGDVWGNHYATIGYSVEGQHYVNNPFTNLAEAHKIGCVNSQHTEWSTVLLSLPVSLNDADLEKQLCEKMISEDFSKYEMFGDIFAVEATLEKCPCSQIQARNDWRFRVDENVDIDGLQCYFQRFPSASGSSQYCCYSSSNGALTQTLNETYGTNMVLYHPLTQKEDYEQYDRTFRETCCNAGLCNLYTQRRPADRCQNYSVPSLGLVVGNLHFTTLDGLTYTFNGLGDYLLLNDTSSTFQVQVRTKTIKSEGYNATRLDALALGEDGSNVKVCLNEAGSLVLEYNKENIPTNDIGSYEKGTFYSKANNTIKIQRTDNIPFQPSSLVISFANGIMAMVNRSSNSSFYFTLWVPESFQGLTAGLLGNFNGTSSDDLVSFNGTVLAENATDEQIHEFGEAWTVDDSFFAEPTFPPYTPTFAQDVLKNTTSDMETECKGNIFCVFDAVITGDINDAVVTLEVMERNAQNYKQLGNFPPRIEVTHDFKAMDGPLDAFPIVVTSNGTSVDFSVTVSDANGDNFTSSIATHDLLTTNTDVNDGIGKYSISWSTGDPTDLNILIVSTDYYGASSQVRLQVLICVCGNEGSCPLLSSMTAMPSFGNNVNFDASTVIIPCECDQAWTGPHCTDNIQGCSEGECYGDLTCSDSDGVGVLCPECGSGLLKDGEKCYDEDDCPSLSCEQMCVNKLASPYSCECYPGYRSVNNNKCEDVNECAGFNECHQECNNTEGGYDCYCLSGYMVAGDGTTCKAIANCSEPAEPPDLCANDNGTMVDSCIKGYNLSDGTCTDIDECTLYDLCDTKCTNNMGSFTCSCGEGFALGTDNLTCQDVNECLDAALIKNDSFCPGQQLCENTDGGYTCKCPPGTVEDDTLTECPVSPRSDVSPTTEATTTSGDPSTSDSTDTTAPTVSTEPTTVPVVAIVGALLGVIVFLALVTAIMGPVLYLAKKSLNNRKMKRRIEPEKEKLAPREENVAPSAPEKPRLP